MLDKLEAELKPLQSGLHGRDFLLTWEKTENELRAILKIAEALKDLYGKNFSARVFQIFFGVQTWPGLQWTIFFFSLFRAWLARF